ncbi:LOW QUALITY PROTEIN: hypothetical protein CFOL_v3_13496, partial [Cephalotus follicularis]
LRDLGYRGCRYSWSNGRSSVEQIRCRLDICVANADWMLWFPRASISHETNGISDHCPVLLALHANSKAKKKVTRFETKWVKDKKCGDIISTVWL